MSIAPARPAKAPEIAIARIRFFLTLMPPYAAASGLKPTAFTSYPSVVRLRSAQKTMSAAMEAKGAAERAAHTALGAMNIPTSGDVKKLEGKIEELEKVFEGLSAKIAELQKKEPAGPQTH